MRFRATLELGGKTATGVRVPEQIVSDLGSGRKPAVRVTIRGHSYPSTVATMSGAFMIPVSAEIRAITGVVAGDEVDVEVELDTEPRTVAVPADFAAALDGDPVARRYFDGSSYSNQRRFVLSIEGAKSAETRQRRIDNAVTTLHGGHPG
jgi:hypothetical protein